MKKNERIEILKDLWASGATKDEVTAKAESFGVSEATVKSDLSAVFGSDNQDEGKGTNASQGAPEAIEKGGMWSESYTPEAPKDWKLKKGEEKLVHVVLEEIQMEGPNRISKPWVQAYDQKDWIELKPSYDQLGYTWAVIHQPK